MKNILDKIFSDNVWLNTNIFIATLIWFIILTDIINEYLNLGFEWSNYLDLNGLDIYNYLFNSAVENFYSISDFINVAFGIVGKIGFYLFCFLFFLPLGAITCIWPLVVVAIIFTYLKNKFTQNN